MTPKEVRAKWVEALRSGRYKQSFERLGSTNEGYCCLGVLCKLALDEGVISGFDSTAWHLPDNVQAWAGLEERRGAFFNEHGIRCSLMHLNDTHRESFEQIAGPGDVVLDPFSGAGTTGLVALRHGRSYVGIELNPEYAALSRQRIVDDAPLLNAYAEVAA